MMASLTGELGSQASKVWFLFRQCRDFSSKAAFGHFVAAVVTAKLAGALRSGDWHDHFPDKEFFLRLKMADLWFSPSELFTYAEIFSSPEYDLHAQEPGPGDTILDVGANIGLFTVRYARMFPPLGSMLLSPTPAFTSGWCATSRRMA